MIVKSWVLIAASALALVACGSDDDGGPMDADMGMLPDGAMPPDGAIPDGGLADGAFPDGDFPDGDVPDADTPDAPTCSGDERRCDSSGDVERCEGGMFVPAESCPLGCAEGMCTDNAMCEPGARRCDRDVAQICNGSGTAYLFADTCESAESCVAGLCMGACAPGAVRCNGLQAEVCGAEGDGYELAEACETACVRGTCALERLDITEDTNLDGEIVVAGPVNVFPGATLTSPSGNLTIRAERITVDASAAITVLPTGDFPAGRGGDADTCYGGGITSHGGGAGGGYGTAGSRGANRGYTCGGRGGREHGSSTDAEVHEGGRGGQRGSTGGGFGGGVLRLFAPEITIGGSVSADGEGGSGTYTSATGGGSGGGILIAGDAITIAGTVSANGAPGDRSSGTGRGGLGRVKILHGAELDVSGTVVGTRSTSLLPPLDIGSATHPDPERYYNDDFDLATFAWSVPFDGLQAYYVLVDGMMSHVPTAADGDLLMAEAVARDALVPGDNWLHIVSVDAMSAVGTVESSFRVRVNAEAPALSSMSHPSSDTWSTNPNLLIAWEFPHDDANYRGVRYALDHFGDTVPGEDATFIPTSQRQLLQSGLEDGVWAFHVVSMDTRGRPTREASHYRIRVGEDPGVGTAVGSVVSAGEPVSGAVVSIQRGLFPEQATNSTGDFALSNIPAGTWELTVSADGFEPATEMITIEAEGTESLMITLSAS